MINYLKLLYLNDLVFKLLLKIQFSFFCETQKMSTEDEKTETFLTLHSAMAQDEAKAVSDNVK